MRPPYSSISISHCSLGKPEQFTRGTGPQVEATSIQTRLEFFVVWLLHVSNLVCVRMRAHARAHTQVTGQMWELALSFHPAGSGHHTSQPAALTSASNRRAPRPVPLFYFQVSSPAIQAYLEQALLPEADP